MTDPSIQPTQLPLFYLPHGEMEEINYMRHITRPEWILNNLKDPVYFYQPTVTPDRSGGTVYDPIREYRNKKNQEFIDVRREYLKNPSQEPWKMYSSDGQVFKGLPDTLNSTAVIIPDSSQMTIQLIDNSLRVTDDKYDGESSDSKVLYDMHQKELRHQQALIEKAIPTTIESIKRQEQLKAERAREISRTGGEDAISYDDNEVQHEDHFNEDDQGADVPNDQSDDDDSGREFIDTTVDDVDELLEIMNQEISDPSDSDESEEEKPKQTSKEKSNQESASTAQAPSAPISTEEIVKEVFGPEIIKEDELRGFLAEQGFVTQRDLLRKFKKRLETIEQRNAFVTLLNKKAVKYTDSGIVYFKLK